VQVRLTKANEKLIEEYRSLLQGLMPSQFPLRLKAGEAVNSVLDFALKTAIAKLKGKSHD